MSETDAENDPMFFKVLTLHYRPHNGSVQIDYMPGVHGLKEPARHRLLDKLQEVLDPENTWR